MKSRPVTLAILIGFAVMACAAPSAQQAPRSASSAASPAAQAQSGPKRITLAALMDPSQVMSKFDRLLPGASDLEVLIAAGLALPDDHGVWQPVLAQSVP